MGKPMIKETHTRTVVVTFSAIELQTMLLNAVCDIADFPPGNEGISWKITFPDETAGSPPYKTGTQARVEITLDLTQLPRAEERKA